MDTLNHTYRRLIEWINQNVAGGRIDVDQIVNYLPHTLAAVGSLVAIYVLWRMLKTVQTRKADRLALLTEASHSVAEELGVDTDGMLKVPSHDVSTDADSMAVPAAQDLQEAELHARKARAEAERAQRKLEENLKNRSVAEAIQQDTILPEDMQTFIGESDNSHQETVQVKTSHDDNTAEMASASAVLQGVSEDLKEAQTDTVEDLQAAADLAKRMAEEAEAKAKSLRVALSKTRTGFSGRLANVFSGGEIDQSIIDELEQVLFTSDIGVQTADRLLESVKSNKGSLKSAEEALAHLKQEVQKVFESMPHRPMKSADTGPTVYMVVGVNGAGKTTTIGKLTSQLKADGKSVILGAGDTFRAAAQEQLGVWGERNHVKVVTGKEGGDPASVLFDAVKVAKDDGADIVLADTAGRLHTQVNLMEELAKVHRVLGKALDGAPHEVLLVLDGTVGQNAIAQAKQFGEAVNITGVIVTKLDGTAKGGALIGIVDQLKLPIRYIGVGEGIEDLRAFNAQDYVDALFS